MKPLKDRTSEDLRAAGEHLTELDQFTAGKVGSGWDAIRDLLARARDELAEELQRRLQA